MKSFVPCIYLLAATGSQLAFAVNGLDAYRDGNYALAAKSIADQASKDPVADYYMGRMRLYGYGQLKNNPMSLRYFNKAAEKGVLAAQQLLARYKLVEEKDYEKALFWFKKAAEAGDLQAQMYCAAAYNFGLGTAKNTDVARRYFIDAARNDNAIAQMALADQFLDTRDQRTKKLGVIWLTKAANQGNTQAEVKLGEMYAKGQVVTRDPAKAEELLTKAVNKKSVAALIALADLAVSQNDAAKAKELLTKAAESKDPKAQYALARFYMNPKLDTFDEKQAFSLMLEAAQQQLLAAQQDLALMYKDGKGVTVDAGLASQWEAKAKTTEAAQSKQKPEVLAASWLSEGKATNFAAETYNPGGIFTAWHNPQALKENNYNQAPQMELITRAELYKPDFNMTEPAQIAINDYFDLIAPTLNSKHNKAWSFPRYPLDPQIEGLMHNESLAVKHSPGVKMISDSSPYPEDSNPDSLNYTDQKTKGWENQANFQSMLSKLYGQAILGDSFAQFEIGQLYQYGVAVMKNPQQAIVYYQLAAAQGDVRAEYNLGILYLEGQTNPVNYSMGVNWLTDAAFKGNAYAQYALANIYDKGFTDAQGTMVIQPDKEKAVAMYYLSSANGFGMAEYSLADYLVKQKQGGLSIAAKHNREQLIRRLYQGAVDQGVAEAGLPLAFYNAMDPNPKKQQQAFAEARRQAKNGNSEAALLLGMMYERGIATSADQAEALHWYQQASMNPVNSFILGTYYVKGEGVNQDIAKGRALLEKAADAGFSYANLNLAILKHQANESFVPELDKAREQGNTKAGLLLADYYLEQAKDPEKMQQARSIYEYFAEKGDKNAQLKLGYLYDKGLGGQVNREMAAQWYGAAADQGQPVAQFMLGRLYQMGRLGTQPDYALAKKWYSSSKLSYPKSSIALGFVLDTVEDNYVEAMKNYQIAADKGQPIAQYNLGLIYENGKGIPVDYAKAKVWYTKAADQGHARAMNQLAGIYFNGSAGPANEQHAVKLYEKAVALGDADAAYQLGLLSETGVATTLSFPNAVKYYLQAASKGNEKAKFALARMYQYGLGVGKDEDEAARLYAEMAANNNAFAQYQLALIKLKPSGENRLEDAKRLLKEASDNGNQEARKMLDKIDAQTQDKVSFIEPLSLKKRPEVLRQSADRMYMHALNVWNRGDEALSRDILKHLLTDYPQYAPAKRAVQRLNQQTKPVFMG